MAQVSMRVGGTSQRELTRMLVATASTDRTRLGTLQPNRLRPNHRKYQGRKLG